MGKKPNVWIFEVIKKQNLIQEDVDMVKQGKTQEKTEFFLIAEQNNAVRFINVK